jgi:[ribosomal protein S5]-alanine N-acetyltransferase
MELNTERLQLRELLFTDVEKIHELHSLPETDEFNTLGIPESIEVTRQIVSEWLEAQNEVPRKKYVFCIENSEKEFIGLAGLNYGKPAYRNAELWYKLHSKYWGLGYATEVANRILDFGFTDLQLHRIEAGCAVGNLASKRILEKIGMTMEARCREILPIRGNWVDTFEFAILETDYNNRTIS